MFYLLSVNGMEMMTPFPVPTHKRLQDTIRAVILTNENPSLPVPKNKRCFSSKIMSKNNCSSIQRILAPSPKPHRQVIPSHFKQTQGRGVRCKDNLKG